MQFEKHFTLAEANALLPWVRRVLMQIQQIAASVPPQQLDDELAADADAPAPAASPVSQLLGFDHERALRQGYHAWVHDVAALPERVQLDEAWRRLEPEDKLELIAGLVQAVLDHGVVIQDVARGLIDFPALAGGSEVLLCYELKDGPRIVAWHGLHTGFAGRRPIGELPTDEPEK